VANYVNAMEYGLERIKKLPVCLRLIQELHGKLLRGVRGEEHRPGEFRERQNFIGLPTQTVEQARFVPPPVPEMMQALKELEVYMGTPCELPLLVKLGLVHYQFETIHPFMDGNGRIGRLLITLILCERGCLPQPLLYLSAYFERNRDAYMDHLLRLSQQGNWVDWIRFFIQGIAEQSRDAIRRAEKVYDLWDDYTKKVQSARASALATKLVDDLFESPAITVPQAAKRLNITFRSAQNHIDNLANLGILKEATGRQRNRIYIAPGIIDLIESE
jgi:Fic family protein